MAGANSGFVIQAGAMPEIKSSTAGGNLRTTSCAPWSLLRRRIRRFVCGSRFTFPTRIPCACRGLVLGMTARIHFRGPLRYRLRSAAELSQSVLEVSARRALKGPRLPSWSRFLELATQVAKRQTLAAFQMGDVKEAR